MSTEPSSAVVLIDYGMGNLHSAKKALQSVTDKPVLISADAAQILAAERVVLPGVGAIRDCMGALQDCGLDTVVKQVIASGTPLLGICIGMQLLLAHSEENGGVDCLGIFPERVASFAQFESVRAQGLKVPHMGWNRVAQRPHPLWQGIDDNSYFYFVHSYCAGVSATHSAGICHYGAEFAAAVAQDNVFAVQFHPEKSSTNGLQLLHNFCDWTPANS